MQETQIDEKEESVSKLYQYATALYNGGMNSYEAKMTLIKKGIDEAEATHIAESLDLEENTTNRSQAQKDMFIGALWCIGGLLLSLSGIGYLFVGAMLFGVIKFARGLSKIW